MFYTIIGIVIIILLYLIIQYNVFVRANNEVKEAFATMDVYLKKRWDLVPNLVETVKGYAKHEKSLLENLAKLRSSAYENMSISDKISTNEQLNSRIANLFAVAENYPELKASQNFSQLSRELTKIEDDIANSRKYYNAVVKKFNNKVEMFPSNIFARAWGYNRAKMFETENRDNIQVDLK